MNQVIITRGTQSRYSRFSLNLQYLLSVDCWSIDSNGQFESIDQQSTDQFKTSCWPIEKFKKHNIGQRKAKHSPASSLPDPQAPSFLKTWSVSSASCTCDGSSCAAWSPEHSYSSGASLSPRRRPPSQVQRKVAAPSPPPPPPPPPGAGGPPGGEGGSSADTARSPEGSQRDCEVREPRPVHAQVGPTEGATGCRLRSSSFWVSG